MYHQWVCAQKRQQSSFYGAVLSRDSGHWSRPGSLPAWFLASGKILYCLITSFSAHTIFQLVATETSDRDRWVFISSLPQKSALTPLEKGAGSQNGRNILISSFVRLGIRTAILFPSWQSSPPSRKMSPPHPLFPGTQHSPRTGRLWRNSLQTILRSSKSALMKSNTETDPYEPDKSGLLWLSWDWELLPDVTAGGRGVLIGPYSHIEINLQDSVVVPGSWFRVCDTRTPWRISWDNTWQMHDRKIAGSRWADLWYVWSHSLKSSQRLVGREIWGDFRLYFRNWGQLTTGIWVLYN